MFKGHAFAVVNLVIWPLHAGVRICTAITEEKQAMWSAHAEIKKSSKAKNKKDSAKYKKRLVHTGKHGKEGDSSEEEMSTTVNMVRVINVDESSNGFWT